MSEKSKRVLSDDEINKNVLRKAPRREINLQRNLWYKTWVQYCQMLKVQKNEAVLVENIMQSHYESKNETPPRHSKYGKLKYM